MSASKLDTLCDGLLEVRDVGVKSGAGLWAVPDLERAVALLRAFDELAEYALHRAACDALIAPRGMTNPCTCGLSAAQKKIADILEGQG